MDQNLQSPVDNADVKMAFRKPMADAATRKYRRHSPGSESPPDGSPKHDRAPSPKLSVEEPGRVHEDRSVKNEDRRDVDRRSDRTHRGRDNDSYRHSDRNDSRSSHGYSRHEDNNRHEKHGDDDRAHKRFSSRSGWESRTETHSDRNRFSSDHLRNKDSSRDKYDGAAYKSKNRERVEHQRYNDRDSSFDKAGPGRRQVHPEDMERERKTTEKDGNANKRDQQKVSQDYRVEGNYRAKEIYRGEPKEFEGQNSIKDQKKKHDDMETKRSKDRCTREQAEKFVDRRVLGSENQDAASKKQKFSSEDVCSGKRVSKFSSVAEAYVKESSSKQPEDGKMPSLLSQLNASEVGNDINAAKFAAMKAAEMVNQNLVGVGTGFMTADQKKKLLWGNKKAAVEEPGHRWDNAMFSDRERQEKFNKLMGVKGDQKADPKPENKDSSESHQEEKQRELQLDLEKQYTAGLRRRDGRTVGLGL